jgi:hypothetical protein
MAQVLARINVTVVGAEHPEELTPLGFGVAPTIEDALATERGGHGADCSVLVVPHALTTLPIVQGNPLQ